MDFTENEVRPNSWARISFVKLKTVISTKIRGKEFIWLCADILFWNKPVEANRSWVVWWLKYLQSTRKKRHNFSNSEPASHIGRYGDGCVQIQIRDPLLCPPGVYQSTRRGLFNFIGKLFNLKGRATYVQCRLFNAFVAHSFTQINTFSSTKPFSYIQESERNFDM